jgi:hypothetical protein
MGWAETTGPDLSWDRAVAVGGADAGTDSLAAEALGALIAGSTALAGFVGVL